MSARECVLIHAIRCLRDGKALPTGAVLAAAVGYSAAQCWRATTDLVEQHALVLMRGARIYQINLRGDDKRLMEVA